MKSDLNNSLTYLLHFISKKPLSVMGVLFKVYLLFAKKNNTTQKLFFLTYFLEMCATPCYNSVNRWLRNMHASTFPFTDVHGLRLHEGTSYHEDLFESLTVYVSVCPILWAEENIGAKLKKNFLKDRICWITFFLFVVS